MERTLQYIAHLKENILQDGQNAEDLQSIQTVKEHLEGTAALAESFAIPQLKTIAYDSAILHDIGKYQAEFQKRIRGAGIFVDHSTCGAIEAGKLFEQPAAIIMQYIIAGHHVGIPDGGTPNGADEASLSARVSQELPASVRVYADEVKPHSISKTEMEQLISYLAEYIQKTETEKKRQEEAIDEFAFIVRYCFSCLVDADSLDTEHFCNDVTRLTLSSDYVLCLDRLNRILTSFSGRPEQTPLQKARTRLQAQAYENIKQDADIYLMNMPTGSGKTLCSAKCALMKAIEEKKRHIIYIIPYNSIISQTAQELEKIFNPSGEQEAAHILRHQSSYSIDDVENADDVYKIRVNQATENWDADIIITTVVQFFETVFSNRRSKLRKMHNMADSVLIFDEAHLMPVNYMQPCLESIAYLTKMFDSKAILLTATMPSYRDLFNSYAFRDLKIASLVPDHADFPMFKKCRYCNLGKISYEQLAARVDQTTSSLIVVNSRKTAREFYEFLGGENRPDLYHLSTYMTKYDLQKSIDEIKKRLIIKEDESSANPLIVVSTSLIEAGVDLDFQTAFRECTGLDSILQTGGRCNREGRRASGDVCIFELEQPRRKADDIKTTVTKALLKEGRDVSDPDCILEYFDRVYKCNTEEMEQNTMHCFMEKQAGLPLSISCIPFRSYDVRIIDSTDESVIVTENGEATAWVNQLRYHGISRSLMRKIQKYTCTVPRNMMDQLMQQGVIEELSGAKNSKGVFVLSNNDYYNLHTGIQCEGKDIFI